MAKVPDFMASRRATQAASEATLAARQRARRARARAAWVDGTCAICGVVGPVTGRPADELDRCRSCLRSAALTGDHRDTVLMSASSPVKRQCPVCNTRFDARPDPESAGRRPTYCSPKCRRVQERRVAKGRKALGALVAQSAGPGTVEQIDAAVATEQRAVAGLEQRYTAVAEEYESVRAAITAGKDPSGRGRGVLQDLEDRRSRLSRDLEVARSRLSRARVWAVQAKAALERGAVRGEQLERQLNEPLEVF